MKLQRHHVFKPWGSIGLPPAFADIETLAGGEAVGEVWFEAPPGAAAPPLLVKHLFTSERLSVQVHPDDAAARLRGFANGKEECWLVLDAEPDARIGLGLRANCDQDTLRAAALNGEIVELMDWRKVAAGDFIHVPPGTIHAIGGGLWLLEIQQPSDLTYRLYDYGRPRELHLDDGLAVAMRSSAPPTPTGRFDATTSAGASFAAAHFQLHLREASGPIAQGAIILPLDGEMSLSGERLAPGEAGYAEAAGMAVEAAMSARWLEAICFPQQSS